MNEKNQCFKGWETLVTYIRAAVIDSDGKKSNDQVHPFLSFYSTL